MNRYGLELVKTTSVRGKRPKTGQIAFLLPKSLVDKHDEFALTISFITNRRLFGAVYMGLQSDYFFAMRPGSGVYVCPCIPTELLSGYVAKPGDVDLLVIPYEGNRLVLDRVLAIEIKCIRAKFTNQGKSPNEFGFSQAEGLLSVGFPYVAIVHLIISDESPPDSHEEWLAAKILDESGRAELLGYRSVDTMPGRLIDRAFGKLLKSPNESVGLAATYIGSTIDALTGRATLFDMWEPNCRNARFNPNYSDELLQNIFKFFEDKWSCFLDNPRFDPAE